mgnify:CR=1 FL=1
MRIIAGKHKGRSLIVYRGKNRGSSKNKKKLPYRPTTDFLRETLFNIISGRVVDCSFADIFAGCGSVGIEAISRGASNVTFVDSNLQNINVIKDNLKKIDEKADVLKSDAINFLKNPDKSYDIVFIDPPYYLDYENRCIYAALNSEILNPGGIMILQHHIKVNLKFEPYDKRKYIPNVLSFYKKE